jgi:phospholipid/cholesterol/gamma-HCH transport system permease protein
VKVAVRLGQSLTAEQARDAYAELLAAARQRPQAVEIDLRDVEEIDTAGVAAIRVGRRRLERAGARVEVTHASARVATVLDETPEAPRPERPPARGMMEQIGRAAEGCWKALLDLSSMSVEAMRGTAAAVVGRRTFSRGESLDQMVLIGVDALPIIGMLSFLLGTVLAFQTWVQLRDFGAGEWVSHLVGIGMSREFGPFIVAIILAGRSGSAIAAELSTMEMREENDALRVLGVSPVRHLVVPRLIGMTLVIPGLTLVATAIGMAGGILVTGMLGQPYLGATESMLDAMSLDDIWLGLVKSVLFGWVIALAGSYTGFHSGQDARSVGAAATRAVVASIFFIVVIDSIVTTAWTVAPR